jgi:uncharacterized repeat protein (TIGR03943 family)
MSAKSSPRNAPQSPAGSPKFNRQWIDTAAVLAWGGLLLKYWQNGALNILIHPSYFGLTVATAIALLLIGLLKAYQLFRFPKRVPPRTGHVSLLPEGWTTGLLLATAIVGLLVTPRVFASYTAVQRGVQESTVTTRVNAQSFRSQVKPENRSLVDWVRTLAAYPEPDTYVGQKVNVNGFVVESPQLGSNHFLLSRFVLTCCAADVYPVAIPVKFPVGESYKRDQWLQVSGKMTAELLDGKRQVVLVASSLKPIPVPEKPYDY